MCNLYVPAPRQVIEQLFALPFPDGEYGPYVAPLKQGPFVVPGRAMVGQWGLIPPSSPSRIPSTRNGKRLSTNNARREGMASAMSFRPSWTAGRRCLIPALSFDEPYWAPGAGRSVSWRFRRADGQPWALAGLWNEWTDPGTGEVVHSYTMITQNCDGHALLRKFHKPDPYLPADQQDKRTVVPIAQADWGMWLEGPIEEAEKLIQLAPVEAFAHGPVDETVSPSILE